MLGHQGVTCQLRALRDCNSLEVAVGAVEQKVEELPTVHDHLLQALRQVVPTVCALGSAGAFVVESLHDVAVTLPGVVVVTFLPRVAEVRVA